MRRACLTVLVALLALLALPALAADDLWSTDFEAAKTKAKAESKLILADFTGSDWCGWCIKLKKEVFDQEAFRTAAPKSFVLLELDYPNKKVLPAELKAQNEKLRDKYKIRGYPTILVLDAEGNAVGKTGYRAGGPEKYVEHLAELRKAADDLAKLKTEAAAAKGIERARLLDKLIGALDKLGTGGEDVPKWVDEIVTLDADGKAGLKPKYVYRQAMGPARALKDQRKYVDAKAAYEKVLAMDGLTPEQKQDTLFEQGECLFYVKDYVGLVAVLKKAVEAAPESAKAPQLKSMITRFQAEADKQAKQ
jgi:thioredoxin-related protein